MQTGAVRLAHAPQSRHRVLLLARREKVGIGQLTAHGTVAQLLDMREQAVQLFVVTLHRSPHSSILPSMMIM